MLSFMKVYQIPPQVVDTSVIIVHNYNKDFIEYMTCTINNSLQASTPMSSVVYTCPIAWSLDTIIPMEEMDLLLEFQKIIFFHWKMKRSAWLHRWNKPCGIESTVCQWFWKRTELATQISCIDYWRDRLWTTWHSVVTVKNYQRSLQKVPNDLLPELKWNCLAQKWMIRQMTISFQFIEWGYCCCLIESAEERATAYRFCSKDYLVIALFNKRNCHDFCSVLWRNWHSNRFFS